MHHPNAKGPTTFYLTDLKPAAPMQLEAVAIGRSGAASPPTTLRVTTSASLPQPPALTKLDQPKAAAAPPEIAGKLRVFAYPPMVKIGPDRAEPMFERGKDRSPPSPNATPSGTARKSNCTAAVASASPSSYASRTSAPAALNGLTIAPAELAGPNGAKITADNVELSKNWYAKNHAGRWQPAYAVPLPTGTALAIPDPRAVSAKPALKSRPIKASPPISTYRRTPKQGDYAGAVVVTLGRRLDPPARKTHRRRL